LEASNAAYERARTRVGKVSIATKFLQAVGALPEVVKNFAFSTFLLFYYNQVLGLDALKASAVIAAALTIDAVFDPLIGSFSDGLKTRLGRRHLLMYASAAPIALGLYLAFSPPSGLGPDALLAWLFATVVFTHISMSLFVVPWTALYAEFSDDYDERTQIVTWRYAVGGVGSLMFVVSTWRFIFASTPAFNPGQLNPHAYALFAPFAAIAAAGTVLITTHFTRGQVPFLLQPVNRTPRFSLIRVWKDVSSTFVNHDFLMLFIGALLYAGVSGTTDTLGLYMQTYFWGLAPEQLQWFSVSLAGAFAAFATVGRIEGVFDKKPVLLGSFILLMIDGVVVTGLRLLHLLPPNGTTSLLAILVGNEIVRTYLGTLLGIMFVSMLADTIDLQELRTAKRQEGVFAAALAFSGKATAGVGALVAGFLLEQAIHWPARADAHDLGPSLVARLGWVAGVLVPLLLVIPLLFGSSYRITRQSHALTRAELDRRRALAHAPGLEADHQALELDLLAEHPL
jgi:glycoside/pentoside/hexuronide:cation symporter, GPH family